MSELTPELQSIKDRFIKERGYWRPWCDTLLALDPTFLTAYSGYAVHPARQGPLSKRMVELIYVAADVSATHLFQPGLLTHLIKAREEGASVADVLDVFYIVAAQGLGAVCAGAIILAEEAGLDPVDTLPDSLSGYASALDQIPSDAARVLARLDPEYLQAIVELLGHPGPPGGLTEGEKALIRIALHGCFTGFDGGSLRHAMRSAIEQGVTPSEILQALQQGAHLSVHGTSLGIANLAEAGFMSAK